MLAVPKSRRHQTKLMASSLTLCSPLKVTREAYPTLPHCPPSLPPRLTRSRSVLPLLPPATQVAPPPMTSTSTTKTPATSTAPCMWSPILYVDRIHPPSSVWTPVVIRLKIHFRLPLWLSAMRKDPMTLFTTIHNTTFQFRSRNLPMEPAVVAV